MTINYPTGKSWTDRSGHQRRQVWGEERVILAVMGVWPDGRPHLVHYEVAQEVYAWSALWQHLRARGLDPKAVRIGVSDGSKSLLEALSLYVPQAEWQRCTVHKVRGFERYLKYQGLPSTDPESGQLLIPEEARRRRRHTITAEALAIFAAPPRAEAEQRLAEGHLPAGWRGGSRWSQMPSATLRGGSNVASLFIGGPILVSSGALHQCP